MKRLWVLVTALLLMAMLSGVAAAGGGKSSTHGPAHPKAFWE